MNRSTRIATLGALGAALAFPVLAQTVKVTPLGGIDGEFCPQDRALIFEDPNGTRILYDPGRTVAGAGDPRLGKVDVILVTHMHGDHVGNAHNKAPNSGSCEQPDVSVSAVPNTLAVEIALAKKSKIVTGSEMPPFFAAKLKANGGDPANSILARFGGSVAVGGVRIATVTALHSNGVDPDFIAREASLGDPLARQRSGHGGRQGSPRQQDGSLPQGRQGSGLSPALGQDDGVRRRGQMHGGMLRQRWRCQVKACRSVQRRASIIFHPLPDGSRKPASTVP
jgi:hypothetical protein